jgi:hypothetical protein
MAVKELNGILFGCYAICEYYSLTHFAFLYSAIETRRMVEILRWNNDAVITHVSLRVCIAAGIHVVDTERRQFCIRANINLTKVFNKYYRIL